MPSGLYTTTIFGNCLLVHTSTSVWCMPTLQATPSIFYYPQKLFLNQPFSLVSCKYLFDSQLLFKVADIMEKGVILPYFSYCTALLCIALICFAFLFIQLGEWHQCMQDWTVVTWLWNVSLPPLINLYCAEKSEKWKKCFTHLFRDILKCVYNFKCSDWNKHLSVVTGTNIGQQIYLLKPVSAPAISVISVWNLYSLCKKNFFPILSDT